MDTENIHGMMVEHILVNGKKMQSMDSVLNVGLIKDNIKDNGKIIKCMELGSMYGMMVNNTLVNI